MLYPAENAKDLPEIPKSVRGEVELIAVEHVDEVLCLSLELEDTAGLHSRLARLTRPAAPVSVTELPPPIPS